MNTRASFSKIITSVKHSEFHNKLTLVIMKSNLLIITSMSVNAHELISAAENIADLPKNADSDVMLEKIVSEHKPSKNPIIRLLWIIFGSQPWCSSSQRFLAGWLHRFMACICWFYIRVSRCSDGF